MFSVSSRRCLPLLLLALPPAVHAGAPARPAPSKAALEAVSDIRGRIEAGDCPRAVAYLKDRWKAGHPEVALLAGSMHENGICVKADWDKAVSFYVQAHQGGLPEAAERLAAGYADPARGPDVAAALWWSRQGRGGASFGSCDPSAQAAADPERFVGELQTWSPSKLAICNYVVGVMSTLSAEVNYPRRAQAYSIGGEVTLRFLPGVPRIDLKKGETEAYALYGWVDGDVLRDREAKPVTDSFEKTLREVAQRALRRYPQPPGISPDLSISTKFIFSLD